MAAAVAGGRRAVAGTADRAAQTISRPRRARVRFPGRTPTACGGTREPGNAMSGEIDWGSQSGVTDPGPAGAAIDELPAALGALREASSRLVFHYRAGGDF